MDLKGSKTEKNLYRTFALESRATTKYNLFAEKARAEGYQWIAGIFNDTASDEYAHARVVCSEFLGLVGTSEENLIDSMCDETIAYRDLYSKFEKEAIEEGFLRIARFYKELREVEESHEVRFKEIYDKLKDGTLFAGPPESKWVCMNCGYIHEGTNPPERCPLCDYPQGYFKLYCEIKNL